MRLGLATHPLPRGSAKELEPGVVSLPTQKLAAIKVIDTDTGEPVDNISAFIWGPGEGFSGPIASPGLFDPEHFREGKDYVLIAFECESMQEFEEPPS